MAHGEEDATREIFGYCSHLPVPKWVDNNEYSNCRHCNNKFSAFKEAMKPHHCRLCGHMHCTTCTAKYYVPLIYEQKGKKGPTRVCIRCRDSCLAQKEKEKGAAAAALPTKHAVLTSTDLSKPAGPAAVAARPTLIGGPGVIEIAPPVWDDADRYVDCRKCHKKGGKPHNCRTCGHLYCDSCTVKMSIPAFFEKKNKTGPTRVCGECRFKILGGAKLVEHLSTGPDGRPLPISKAPGAAADDNVCKVPGCDKPRVSKLGLCAAHVNEVGGAAAQKADLAANAAVTIRWEGEAAVLAKVALTDRSMSLQHIDLALKRAVPALAKDPHSFEYLYRNEGIADVFYDIFTAGVFADECKGSVTTVFIRRVVDSDSVLAAYTRQGPGGGRVTHAPGQGGTMARGGGATVSGPPNGAISASSNPFKRKEGDAANVPKVQPKKEEKKIEFRGPKGAKKYAGKGAGSGPSPSKLPPPIGGAGRGGPPSAPIPVTKPGQAATDEVFKQRAKLYFGAI